MEEVLALIKRSQDGDKEAREILMEQNVGLVHHIVKRFLGRGYDAEDLFQIGSIGLLKAIDRFDFSFDVRFSTYAVPMITGEIKRFLRDDGLLKISRSIKENTYKVKTAIDRYIKDKGVDPSLTELVSLTELSKEDIILALEASAEVDSIYKTVYQGDGSEIYLVDKVVAGGNHVGCMGSNISLSGDREKEQLINHMAIEQAMELLEEEDRKLIYMRYYENKTQMEVARILGTNQVQVSRKEKKILQKMRVHIL